MQATLTGGQIELLAERIASLPKDFDHKPLLDQMARLQQLKVDLKVQAKDAEKATPPKEKPVSLEHLSAFRKGLRELIRKGEKDTDLQTAIIFCLLQAKALKILKFSGKILKSCRPGVRLY